MLHKLDPLLSIIGLATLFLVGFLSGILVGFSIKEGTVGSIATISPPSEFPEANLRIDLVIENYEHGFRQPLKGFTLRDVELTCPEIAVRKGERIIGPPWLKWCWQTPLNLPAVTDESGHIVLWFAVEPHPHAARLDFSERDFGEIPAPSPDIRDLWRDSWNSKSRQQIMLAPDHWRVDVVLEKLVPPQQ